MPCRICIKRNTQNCEIAHNATTCVFNPESKRYIHPDKYPLVENLFLEIWGVPKHALYWGYLESANERAKKAKEAKKAKKAEEAMKIYLMDEERKEQYYKLTGMPLVEEDGVYELVE